MAQFVGLRPAKGKATGSIPDQGTYLGFGPDPLSGGWGDGAPESN